MLIVSKTASAFLAPPSQAKAGRSATVGRSIRPTSSSRTNCISLRARLERSPAFMKRQLISLRSRGSGENRVRPKIVASTATVRRAADQIAALFDRSTTSIFPPPGIDRVDSFFARTVPSSTNPARLYLGIAAQGRGPKLVFLRSLTTLVAAAQAAYDANIPADAKARNPADPYMTALCYFNALRELGGARRIVEDEVRDRAARYGAQRRRVDPADSPFADRSHQGADGADLSRLDG